MGCQGSFSSLSNLICSDNFLTHVGAPTMQYYDDHAWLYDGDLDGPQSSTAFIFIPFVHPGRDKYGKQPEALRRVFLLSWMVALTLGSFMMDALENVSDEEEFQGREHICRAVIARFQKDSKELIQSLDDVKAQLLREWTTQNAARTGPSAETRSAISTKNAKVSFN